MNGLDLKKIVKNKTALAIIVGLAVVAVVGSFSVASVIAQSNDASTSSSGSNATGSAVQIPQISGSVNVQQNIISSAKVKLADAANTAATAVGDGSTVIGGRLAIVQNSLVYEFTVLDSSSKMHKVIVDAGDGKVLYTSQGFDMNVQMLLGGHGFGHGHGSGAMGKSHMHQPYQGSFNWQK